MRPSLVRSPIATASAGLTVAVLVVSACATSPTLSAADERVQVVTTTGILRDLVEHVGGDRVNVTSLVPDGGDPHSFEPSLRAVRNVVYADVAFSNYALLEEQRIIKALDANLPDGVPNVALAEGAVKYAAEIIPLVEDVSLDTIWLGMRVRGDGRAHGASRTSSVEFSTTAVEGPGDVVAYLTESLGNPVVYLDSSDGFDASDGYRDDTASVPVDAHTHMSWVFTEPGVYRLTMRTQLVPAPGERPIEKGEATFTFAVGVDPYAVEGTSVDHVLSGGHADIALHLDDGHVDLWADPEGAGDHDQASYDPDHTVISVPNKALAEVPGDPAFRFLGDAGDDIFQLPQAVLGRHIHGEIDPHLWQDVHNAISYVQLIRDTLVDIDPAGAIDYHANADTYVAELEVLDGEVAASIASIPPERRHLVTTHDAFGYLAHAYGLEISGFVTPNPATEPSLADRRHLGDTIRNLDIPAVFLEPNLRARSSTLTAVADELGVAVCPIWGDTFTNGIDSYVEMMRANATSLRECLAR